MSTVKQQVALRLTRDWGESARYPQHVGIHMASRMADALDEAGFLRTPPSLADLGMFTVDPQQVIEVLKRIQHDACAYGTTDGDGRTCDCKFGGNYLEKGNSWTEQTGCPELRQAIRTLEWLSR